MKHLLSLAYASGNINFDKEIIFQGKRIRVTQFSTNFNFDLTKALIEKYDGDVDVICLSGIPPKIRYKGGTLTNPQGQKLKKIASFSSVVDGQILEEVYIPWMMRQMRLQYPELLTKKKIGLYSGANLLNILEVLENFSSEVVLADPYFYFKMPFLIKGNKNLERFLKTLSPVLKRMALKKENIASFKTEDIQINPSLEDFFSCDIFIGSFSTLGRIDLTHLKNKTVITDFSNPLFEKKLKDAGVEKLVVLLPTLFDIPFSSFSLYEGFLQSLQNENNPIDTNDILSWIGNIQLKPEVKVLNEEIQDQTTKFAFIIHPLSAGMVFKHPYLKWMKPYSKPFEKVAENIMSKIPGFYYGKITNIKSEENGKPVEGLIYTVTETPRKLMEKEPEEVYRKLLALCDQAKSKGAKIIGLGAYTKIVGDAGVTVARRSPIPVTTGNSLSAASTLWAAKFAIEKIGLVNLKNGIYQGKVMVIGATGSIGAVSAKILAQNWQEIILVAPRGYKLLELKSEIEKLAPSSKIEVATSPTPFLSQCDLIITTTSAQGKKILEINKVRPGCVICDVSRPFDISEEDALKRPDVLVIASGEVQLPGGIKSNVDLGLEGNIVYACLAETALLAMEGKFENFTLSRNISYKKVLEIDKMAKKHGVRLSCIMGHTGFITDSEFELCRKHALKELQNPKFENNQPSGE